MFYVLSLATGLALLSLIFAAARVSGNFAASPLTIQQVIDATVAREGPGRADGRWVILCRPGEGEKDWDCVALEPAEANFMPDNRG